MTTTVTLIKECPFCLKTSVIGVPLDAYLKWTNGELIQNAMPTLTDDEREIIMTGIHPSCWDELAGKTDAILSDPYIVAAINEAEAEEDSPSELKTACGHSLVTCHIEKCFLPER